MKKVLVLAAVLVVAFFSYAFVKSSRMTASKAVSKSLVFPVAGKSSRYGGYWGDSRGGGVRKHKGIDIFARKGTAVLAVCDGLVVQRSKTPVGGKTLWLKSSRYGWTAYYAHLDKQLVKEGQYVRKGQVIGTVGNTGNARTTPSHLHFGIRPGTGWTNPLPYVKYSPKVSAPKMLKKKSATAKRTVRKKARR